MPRRNYNPGRGRRRPQTYGTSLLHLIQEFERRAERRTERTDR